MKKKKFLPYSFPDIGSKEISQVIKSIQSGWLTTGPVTKEFEKQFSIFFGSSSYAVSVNSATAGLHLALEAIGIKSGDEVIIPSYTFTATAEVVSYLSAIPVIVDVDEETFNINIESIAKAITKKTKAIIVVHFAGLSCEMDEIIKLAKKNKIKIIEDAAHAFPATYKKKYIGNLSTEATVFSFYANKTMTTGEGGMIVTKNKKIADRCKIMRLHGINKDAFDRFRSKSPAWKYDVIAAGYKYNLTDIASSIGIVQLSRIKELQKKRERIAKIYNSELSALPIIIPKNPLQGDIHSRHLYPILLKPNLKINRNSFIDKMHNNNVGCSVHYLPLHMQTFWKKSFNLNKIKFPVSTYLYQNEISIPLFSRMTDDEIDKVIDSIKKILKYA
jgi:dTDP-4-amino-4,6-dideoxygalactose transaminase